MKKKMIRELILTGLIFIFLTLGSINAFSLPNKVDYRIKTRLDTETSRIYAGQLISFTNMTGKSLSQIWLHVFPNAFKNGIRSQYMKDLTLIAGAEDPGIIYKDPDDDAYLKIENIAIKGQSVSYKIEDTLMLINLTTKLAWQETLRIKIDFIYDLMETTAQSRMAARWAVRSGHRNGVYTISKWYPQVAIYDQTGWNLDQYRYLGEFYADFASYQIEITVPEEMIVGATGDLENTIHNLDHTKTLKYRAFHVHDFAWVASGRYQVIEHHWEDITVKTLFLDQNKNQIGIFALDALKYYSQQFGTYPYQNLTVAQVEVGGGMEYPGIVMIGDGYRREVVHETAHQWWYGTVGNDEMDQPWLDEGLTVYSTEHYLINKGEDSLYVRHSTHFREIGIPVLTSSIHFPSIDEYFEVIYKKGSGILWMLEGLLGEELMQEVMREYYLSYKFENVGVQDFVATVNRVAESDFDWFFDQWLTTTKKLDFSVTSVSQEMSPYTNSSYLHRFRVNRVGGAIMPVRIEITLNVKGRKKRIYRQWDGKGSWKEFFIRAEGRLESIVVDPHKIILEENRANNHWYSTI